MPITRFRYPGVGPNINAYSGVVSPRVRREIRLAGVTTSASTDGPMFGRSIWTQPGDMYEFGWAGVTHEEAREIYRRWEDARQGTAPVYYTPQDQSEPITMILADPPRIEYVSGAVANVTAVAEEQR